MNKILDDDFYKNDEPKNKVDESEIEMMRVEAKERVKNLFSTNVYGESLDRVL